MKLKIVSEGTGDTTRVVDAETGEEVEGVISLDLSLDAFHVDAAIVIRDPHLSIDNLNAPEVREGDSGAHDGTTGDSDNQQHSEPTSFQV